MKKKEEKEKVKSIDNPIVFESIGFANPIKLYKKQKKIQNDRTFVLSQRNRGDEFTVRQ